MHGPENSDRLLEIGELNAAYGIKGWVKVFSFTRPIEQIFEYSNWQLNQAGRWQSVVVEGSQIRPNQSLIVKLKGIDDRDAALALKGQTIAIEYSQLATLANGEFYWRQLLGLEVINSQSEHLGKVVDMLETGANDVLVVNDGETQRLIPYAQTIVLDVDLETGRIQVDWEKDF